MNIYQKIVSLKEELIPIGKIKREEIIAVVQPLLVKYNLVIKPDVDNYKYENQEASFKAIYEIVDAEDSNLESILIKVPAGGFDQEGKGRATYMASTGAYRQALQQIFSIPIEEDFALSNNNDFTQGNNEQDDFSVQHDFQDAQPTAQVTNGNSENSTQEQTNREVNVNELTDSDIDREFESF